MIEMFDGRPGSYKSYTALRRAMKYLASGGVVCTNIEICPDAVKARLLKVYGWEWGEGQYVKLTGDNITSFFKHTPKGDESSPTLVIIDEAHIWLNARDWNSQSRELLDFFTVSRHENTDVIMITQHADNVDKQVRRLVQYYWRMRDMQKLAVLGVSWDWPTIWVQQFDQDGKTLLRSFVEMKDGEIYKLYNHKQVVRTFPRLEAAELKKKESVSGKVAFA